MRPCRGDATKPLDTPLLVIRWRPAFFTPAEAARRDPIEAKGFDGTRAARGLCRAAKAADAAAGA
jgi:hypothetical protein